MNKKLLKKLHFIADTEGTSMKPMIHPHDNLYIRPILFKQIKINDIIVFEQNNELIIHRVIYRKAKYLITKGDNNPINDGKIYKRNIFGKVYQVKRSGKIFNLEQLYLIQSTLYFQEIVKVIKAFEKKKINFVFLKGLPLHLHFEKGHPRRIYADCDVLIDKKNIDLVKKILINYRYEKLDMPLADVGPVIKEEKAEFSYIKRANGFFIIFDIHTEVVFMITKIGNLEALYPQKLIYKLTKELLNNKQQIKINNEKILIINSNFLILYLALHLFNHNFQGMFRYRFLDKIIRKYRLSINNWQKIASTTNDYQLINFIYPVFVLLKKYYQTPIPNYFINSIKPLHDVYTFTPINKIKIFDDQSRFQTGIARFKNLFLLSPQPWWKKIFVFANPSVVYFIFWSLKKKLFSYLKVI